MKGALLKEDSISQMDSLVLNYAKSFKKEFLDKELLSESRFEVFMALSAVRKYEFFFYPIKQSASCLLVGDNVGALAGALLDKCQSLHSLLPSPALMQGVKERFCKRKNFFVHDSFGDTSGLKGQFDYAAINLEKHEQWSLDAPSAFFSLVNPALQSLKKDGKLLISLPAFKIPELKELLCQLASFKMQAFDPFGMGLCLLEAVVDGNLTQESDLDWSAYKMKGFFRSPLLNQKWIRENDFPIWSENEKDQDAQKIQEVKDVQIDLLKKLARVCEENGLTLYPIYGSLLGLMRGGSFIDGDDDIDVALMREDYEKLLSLKDAFSGEYFLQTPQNDNCFFGGYAKLRNSNTSSINPQNWWVDCNEGISIDIFPIDKAFSKNGNEKRRLRKIRFLQRLLYAYSYGYFRDFSDMKLLKWKAHKYLGKLLNRKKVLEKFESLLKAGDSKSKLSIYTHYKNGQIKGQSYFSAEDFKKNVKLDFEGTSVSLPCGWKNILQERYGESFMDLPQFNEWKFRHGFYDAKKPYSYWKNRFSGLKNPGGIKEDVIVFGDGSIFKALLSYYKSRVKIPCMVLLPGEEKTEKSILGVPLLTFEEFKEMNLSAGSYRGVICSGDPMAADALLEKNSLPNLYIFWYDRNWMLFANQSAVWKAIRNLI